MMTFVSTIHITVCIILVLIVLVQSGKGAEISASFGGSSQTVFGSSGGANVFQRATATLAGIFMLTSVFLTVQGTRQNKTSVFDRLPVTAAPAKPGAVQSPPAVAPAPKASVPAAGK